MKPFWFEEPNPEPIEVNFQSSNLPIVIVNTNGTDIPTEPKIPATIKIIKRPETQRNYVTDENNSDYIDYERANSNWKSEVHHRHGFHKNNMPLPRLTKWEKKIMSIY